MTNLSSRCTLKWAAFVTILVYLSPSAFAQFSDQYRQAAQALNNAAAQCTNPAGAACYRQYANYNMCLANDMSGKSCGAAPTCTATCSGTGSGSTAGSSVAPALATGLPVNPKAQAVGNLVGLGMSLWLNHHSQNSETETQPQPDPAAEAAAEAAANQQQINAEAGSLLQDSNALMASLNGGITGAPNAAPALNSLLGNSQPSNAANSQINNLLGGSSPSPSPSPSDQNADDPNANTNSTIASLLGNPANAGAPGSPSSVFPAPLPANVMPPDPQMDSALEDSADDPDPTQASSLGQMFQSATQQFKDGLNSLVSSAKTLTSNVMNDPVVQWAVSDKGSLSTVPLPQAGDTPEVATDKVFAQSVVGFNQFTNALANGKPVDFAEGVVTWTPLGVSKAVYKYGVKMVNQIGADLGLAFNTATGVGPGFSDSQGN